MAKLSYTSITSSQIESYLNSQDDFALEMLVYSEIISMGYVATHGGTYTDPITEKPRQYDIRAHIEKDDRRVDFAIECKSLKENFPLVVSRIPRDASESYHQLVCSIERSPGLLSYAHSVIPAKTIGITNGESSSLYPVASHVGKSTTQVGLSEKGDFVAGDAAVYDKWSQAISSLSELVSDATWYKDRATDGIYITACFPILVVPQGTLWVADYDAKGKLLGAPTKIDEATVFLGQEIGGRMTASYAVSHLHVVTVPGLIAFMNAFKNDERTWKSAFPLKEILQRLTED